jgi:UDP-N-acetylglucosamine:LPS N-acetylglucosamine transferase
VAVRAGASGTRVLLVGSSGGHLAQLLALRPWWQVHARRWVTFDTPDAVSSLAGEEVVWAHRPTTRSIPNLLRNARLAWRVTRRFRPSIVVSTGAGVAFPFFLVARLLGAATCFVEVYDRLDSATLTGRLCAPISDLVCVQWEEQLGLYGRARLIGRLL